MDNLAMFASLMSLAVGSIFASLGFTSAVKALRFQQRAHRATGVIVAAKSRRELWAESAQKEGRKVLTELPMPSPGESEWWTITVEFADAAGATRRANVDVSKVAGEQAYQVGDPQPILYDPEPPWEIQTDTAWNWFGPLVLGALGTVFVAAGVVLWIVGILAGKPWDRSTSVDFGGCAEPEC
jgi:hypothetical protein